MPELDLNVLHFYTCGVGGFLFVFFNCKKGNTGIDNAYDGLKYLTSHSPISTENR